MALDQRTSTAGKFNFTVDGSQVAFIKSFSGCDHEGDVVANDLSGYAFQSKHLANFKTTPGKVKVGAGMGKHFWDWMKASLEAGYVRKSGSLIWGDFDYNARTELTWKDALITSVGLPAFDASAKEAIYIDVEIQPEQIRIAKASGKIASTYKAGQKAFLSNNFRLEIDGLNCTRTSKIDAMVWKCSVATDHTGPQREPQIVPAKQTHPDMKFYVSATDFADWSAAAEKWFIAGDTKEEHHYQGRITLLGPNMKDIMAVIELKNLGFKSFKRGALTQNDEKVASMEIEMYMEHMQLSDYKADA
jgi:hypothetical protein